MAHDLTAALILKLTDQLSGPIDAIMRRLERLKAMTERLTMGGLENGGDVLDRVRASAERLRDRLDTIPAAARRGADALRRMGAITVNGAGVAFTPAQAAMAARAAMLAMPLAIAAAGGGLRLPPPAFPRDAPFAGSQLLLGGPAAGGIPIAPLRAASGQWANMRMQAAGFRRELGGGLGLMREFGHGTRSLAEGAMGAAATGFGLFEPIKMYAEQENTLRHMAITAGKTGPAVEAMIADIGPRYQAMALKLGQRSNDVIEAASFLSTTGIGQEMVDRLVPTIAKAATAYNTPMRDATQMAFTLNEVLKVPAEQMERVLSMGALAGKASHFSFADQSRFLPEIASAAGMRNITGPEGAASLFAMLATSRRHAGTSGQAATNVQDLLAMLDQHSVQRGFAKHGVDLSKMLLDAEKKGINPMEAVSEKLLAITRNLTAAGRAGVFNDIFHNQQARTAVQALAQDVNFYLDLKKKLLESGPEQIQSDWEQAMRAPLVSLKMAEEQLSQITTRIGQGFAPMLAPINAGLWRMLDLMHRLDTVSNQRRDRDTVEDTSFLDGILSRVGGFLALTTVMGILAPVLKLMRTGFLLLVSPINLALRGLGFLTAGIMALTGAGLGTALSLTLAGVAAVGGAAYLLYENWGSVGPWFGRLWDSMATYLHGYWDVLAGIFTGDAPRMLQGFREMWDGLTGFFGTLWEGIQGTFTAFVGWVDGWSGGAATAAVEGIKTAWGVLRGWFETLANDIQGFFDRIIGPQHIPAIPPGVLGVTPNVPNPDDFTQPPGKLPEPAHADPDDFAGRFREAAKPTELSGTLHITVDAAGRVTSTTGETNQPGVKLDVNRGEMAGRD